MLPPHLSAGNSRSAQGIDAFCEPLDRALDPCHPGPVAFRGVSHAGIVEHLERRRPITGENQDLGQIDQHVGLSRRILGRVDQHTRLTDERNHAVMVPGAGRKFAGHAAPDDLHRKVIGSGDLPAELDE